MGWLLLPAMIVILLLAMASLALRRAELRRMSRSLATLAEAKVKGSHRARLQYPSIDLSRCMGCGTCVKACPEDGVLDLIHGQAVVIHGGRCVGHGLCAAACPVGAIDLTLSDLQGRRDIPAVSDQFEATTNPNHLAAGFPQNCETCHNTNTWLGATFTHRFNINSGPHRSFTCAECHQTPSNYQNVSCTHCDEHRQAKADDKHSGVPGYTWNSSACVSCHPNGR